MVTVQQTLREGVLWVNLSSSKIDAAPRRDCSDREGACTALAARLGLRSNFPRLYLDEYTISTNSARFRETSRMGDIVLIPGLDAYGATRPSSLSFILLSPDR